MPKDIVHMYSIPNGAIAILAALIFAIIWNLITWYFRIPSSSSHALIGSIAGAAITASVQSFAHGTNDAQKSMKIKPVNGVAADLSSAMVIFGVFKFRLLVVQPMLYHLQ